MSTPFFHDRVLTSPIRETTDSEMVLPYLFLFFSLNIYFFSREWDIHPMAFVWSEVPLEELAFSFTTWCWGSNAGCWAWREAFSP